MPSQSISLQEICRIASERTEKSRERAIKLCDRCSNIQMQLEHDLPVSDEVIFLGPLKRIKERKHCPLCRLIVKSLPRDDTTADKGDIQYTLNPRHDCGETFALFFGTAIKSALKAYIRIEIPPGILEGFSNSSSPVQGLESHRLHEVVKNTLTIDFQKVQSWLNECEWQHGARCDGHEIGRETRDTEGLLLVDVVEERLVDGNRDSRYIALSYVWGGWGGAKVTLASRASVDFLRTKGAFRSTALQLPKVLRDAMSFVRSIGERYLWCDAICVLQDDRVQKYQQIAQMDVIYRRALLTIIALSGQHGNQALPGVQKDSRQPIVSVSEAGGGVRFIARALSLTVLAAESIYESRAWTFQEKLLSRRCLMMTDSQVFFCCSLKCFREDEDLLDSPDQKVKRSKLYYHNAGLATVQDKPDTIGLRSDAFVIYSDPFGLYSNLVKDYTNRNLTNPSDILDAFKGISKILEWPFGDSFIMGLPRSHLHDALLWTPQSRIQKRSVPTIPSWSWAAYTGQICYHWPNSIDPMTGEETRYENKSILISQFHPIIPNPSSTCRLRFQAYTLPFHPICLEGGQLYRNSFSMSSYLTTHDGKIQCDVATLELAMELGVPAGQEIQPATIMWNPVIARPYGIVLDNEDACKSRISERRCHLVLLSKCYISGKELWQNCLIVAETTSGETLERIAVARAKGRSIEKLDLDMRIKQIQLV